MKTLLVYKDYGQWIECPLLLKKWIEKYVPKKTFKVEYTDATSIIKLDALEDPNVVALFMPGGHSRGYADKLNGEGNVKIKSFVEKGGFYFGFCGGAYYASKKTIFKGENLRIEKENELGLVSVSAEGSIPELTGGNYFDESIFSTASVEVKMDEKNTSCIYYSGGPFFQIDLTENVKALAMYREIEKPCVVKQVFGKGEVVLSGVHPEYMAEDLKPLYQYTKGKARERFYWMLAKITAGEKDGSADQFAELLLKDLLEK